MISPDPQLHVCAEFLGHFEPDAPRPRPHPPTGDLLDGQIEGCTAVRLSPISDDRGDLVELLTARCGNIEPIVHVYQVFCGPGSIRAWVYTSRQTDRLCYTDGSFRIVLCDLRSSSPTAGKVVTLFAGAEAPMLLSIPPFVAHGVQNVGSERAAFLNMPTRVYRHEAPDKSRLPFNSPLIPYTW